MSAIEPPDAFEGSPVEARLLELGRLYRLAQLHGWQEDDLEGVAAVRQRWNKLKEQCEATGVGLAKLTGAEK
jgi:hypothetical protein